MLEWDDIQSWCNDLSNWIVELGQEKEVKVAFPKGDFPLTVDKFNDEKEEAVDVLAYLTLWMCCKKKTRAPAHLESRILLVGKFKGPWQKLYLKVVQKFEANEDIDFFSLAS